MSDNELSNMRLKNYGFIFQDFKLFENETILANLLFPLETIYHLSKEKKKRKCQDLLSLVGLEDREKQIVNKLSGGEKQRVAIARALINDPKVVWNMSLLICLSVFNNGKIFYFFFVILNVDINDFSFFHGNNLISIFSS